MDFIRLIQSLWVREKIIKCLHDNCRCAESLTKQYEDGAISYQVYSKLYDAVTRIYKKIESRVIHLYKTKGRISVRETQKIIIMAANGQTEIYRASCQAIKQTMDMLNRSANAS